MKKICSFGLRCEHDRQAQLHRHEVFQEFTGLEKRLTQYLQFLLLEGCISKEDQHQKSIINMTELHGHPVSCILFLVVSHYEVYRILYEPNRFNGLPHGDPIK